MAAGSLPCWIAAGALRPLSLSDGALAALLDVARPIPPRDRDPFLRDVTAELAKANSLK
jgi:hypothetical protein